MDTTRPLFRPELDGRDRAERRRQWAAVESWVANSLAAAYVMAPGEPLPRELVALLPEA